MKDKLHFISKDSLRRLLYSLKKDYEVYVPIKKNEQRFYKHYDEWSDDIVIGEVRSCEPLKAFFIRSREKVSEGFKDEIPHSKDKPYCIVGVKNCDLSGFKIQDYVFMDHDFKDPAYIKNRKENLIISSDCTLAIDTCFCLSLGNKPYPQNNFDINLSPMRDGFVVEIGSEKGDNLRGMYSKLFTEVSQKLVDEKEKQRQGVIKELEENIKENKIPDKSQFKGIIEKNYDSEIWKDEAKECVECAACTIICPACHCFLLYDQKDEDKIARLRVWDSCMLKGYARVAGGANPRGKLWMRLRNRFEKKFDFFPKVAETYGCTGCGRCISACPAKIDIRKVLGRLVENA